MHPVFLVLLGFLALMPNSRAQALERLAITIGPDIPHILTGEVALIYTPRWTIAVRGGGFAYTFQSDSYAIPASVAAGDLRLRYFPFNGSFFVGLAGGLQNLAGSTTQTYNVTVQGQNLAIPASASASVLTPYVTPHLGWFVVTRSGFTFGFEAGVQFAFNSTSNLNLSISDPTQSQYLSYLQALPQYQQVQSDVQGDIDKYANHWLPYTSIRLGWTF